MLVYLGYVLVKSKLKHPPTPGNLQAFEVLKISVFKILHYTWAKTSVHTSRSILGYQMLPPQEH